jgi:nucleoside-diphosphate-sugar epimerase
MKVLLTGGSGNLGHALVPKLLDKGDTPIILDIRAPLHLQKGAVFIEGSILDRPKVTEIFRGCDCIVHIAVWHGIHEDRGEKNPHDFFDLNVRGTFEVFEGTASAVTAHPPLGQNAITSAMPTDPVAGERVGRHGAIEPSG